MPRPSHQRTLVPALGLVLLLLCSLAAVLPTLAQIGTEPNLSLPVTSVKLKEVFDSGIFTYMKTVTPSGVTLWIVTPACGVKEGDVATVTAGQFYSQVFNEELGITFDNLLVATKLTINGQPVGAFEAHELPKGCLSGRPPK